jgi:hypothetical protein
VGLGCLWVLAEVGSTAQWCGYPLDATDTFFQQVFEAARGFFRVVFHRALDSRDYVVWLALAIRT